MGIKIPFSHMAGGIEIMQTECPLLARVRAQQLAGYLVKLRRHTDCGETCSWKTSTGTFTGMVFGIPWKPTAGGRHEQNAVRPHRGMREALRTGKLEHLRQWG